MIAHLVPRMVRKPFWVTFLVTALVIAQIGGPAVTGAAPAGHGAKAAIKRGGTLTIITELGALWSCNFSPFVPPINATPDSWGLIYEPLIFINGFAKKGMKVYTPWLASAFKWSNHASTLTFTIRKGVKWSDGVPFTAADVVFTFKLIMAHPQFDLGGALPALNSVKQQGSDQVVMSLKPGAVPFFFNIADQTWIVPKHVWGKVADPVNYVDSNPVGTGPLIVQQCTPQNITYGRNPTYWQKRLPYVDKVQFPAFTSNPPANLALSVDPGDWGGQFLPNIKSYYLAKDPKYRHYWFPACCNNDVFPNLNNKLLAVRAVRQAMSYAIDRKAVDNVGEFGYEPPSSQTGLLLPAFSRWYDKSLAAKYNAYKYSPSTAISILEKAGYKKGSDGIYADSSGNKLSFHIIVIAGNTDSVADCQVVRDDLAKVGIQVIIDALSGDDYGSRLGSGNFDLAWSGVGGGPNPYYELRNLLYSKGTINNFEHYKVDSTNALFDQFAQTASSAKQHQIIDKLQEIMLRDVPVIPTVQGVFWYQWSDRLFVGWPTQKDPYANGCPYCAPDWEVVLLRLHLR